MKVVTTKIGFYGKLRKVGEEFEIRNEKELGSWMKEVKEAKKAKAPKKVEAEKK